MLASRHTLATAEPAGYAINALYAELAAASPRHYS